MSTNRDDIIARAEFDKRLPNYFMLQSLFGLLTGFITIPLIPIWFIFGKTVHQRQYDSLACELTPRSLNVRKGFLFKIQKSIPLDKITDLAVNEGPILRYLGLCSLQIETAGGGQGTDMGQASLPGVVDAIGFRDKVLAQRDGIVFSPGDSAPKALLEAQEGSESSLEVLKEIRDTLQRIERQG